VAGLEAAFQTHGDRIAGVIFEPIVGNMGVVIPNQVFSGALTKLTQQHGALLICDEVMTGFRIDFGGAQKYLGIRPDITTMGKIVGGGLPVGAYGGRAEIMNHILPAGKVFQAGTLSGNPLATAAGCATLKLLKDEPPYERLEQLSARLAAGLRSAAENAGVTHAFARVASMMTLFFGKGPITGWQSASHCDTGLFAKFFWGMMDRGVYLPCSQYEALFVSAAHTEADIDQTISAAEDVLVEISK
jgi:glutamate-1-semialdehyde 2,1-aminomutase